MADLGARAAAGMAQLIAARTALMVDACRVTRPTDGGQTPVLDADGNPVPAAGTVVYEGPCTFADPRIPTRRGGITVLDQSGAPEQRQLRTPHTAGLRTGDLVEALACAFSPGMVGDLFAVVREDERTYATYRAYIVRGSSWQAPSG